MITRVQENPDEHSEEKDNVVELKKRQKTPYIITAVLLLTALIVAAYFYFNRTYSKYEVDSESDRADETAMEYISFQGGFVKYNVDGITFEDKTGTIIWTEAFTMTEPKVVTKGEYVVVTDIGNNEYTLYNTSKKLGTFTTDYPVTDIQVANQGLVAVVLEDEKVNYIVAFDKEGEKCIEIKTTISKNGYPIAIALSEDGTRMVASYVTVQGTQVESSLTFYNFDNVGKNEVDRQVGYQKFDDELIPSVEFVTNDVVCAFGNERIVLYAMKEKPKEITNRKLENEIKSIFYNKKYVGYVYKDTELKSQKESTEILKEENEETQEDSSGKYILKAYTLKGKLALTQDIDFNYTSIHSTEDEVVVLSGDRCKIYKYNGFVKFDSKFDEGISEFFPTTRRNHYVLITNDYTRMIHLK